jgi:hypothetical protein
MICGYFLGLRKGAFLSKTIRRNYLIIKPHQAIKKAEKVLKSD